MLQDINKLAITYVPSEHYAISTIVFLHGGDCFFRKTCYSWYEVIKTIHDHEFFDDDTNNEDIHQLYNERRKLLTPNKLAHLRNGGCLDTSRLFESDFNHGWVIIRLPNHQNLD